MKRDEQADATADPTNIEPVPTAMVRLMGPVAVWQAHDRVVPPSRTQRAIVAMLAVAPHGTRSSQRLARDLGISAGALRTTVARLRRLLGPGVVTTVVGGYRLQAAVDVHEIRRLSGQGTSTTLRGRLEDLERATALITGEPLEEFEDDAWASPHLASIQEICAAAVEQKAAVLLELSRYSDAITVLEGHLAENPLRDPAYSMLMTALAQDGRQAEALGVYRRYHDFLSTEVGTDPSAAVQATQQAIARAMDRQSPTPIRPGVADPTVPAEDGRHLPHYRSSFVGRASLVERTADMVATTPLVTLAGPAGVGKTRLAVAVLDRVLRNGHQVTFVELAAAGSDDVLSTVARAMGSTAVEMDHLLASLRSHTGLVALDNCEHVVDAVADLVDHLSAACPGMALLLTSRRPLRVDGERVVRVPPLGTEGPAEQLFVDRAAAAGLAVTNEESDLVRRLCTVLDGLPLAIEIAATRAANLGLASLVEHLHDDSTMLAAPRRGRGAHHRSLAHALQWSYRLLGEDERRTLRCLSAFADGFELDAVESVLGGSGSVSAAVPHLMAELVERSMVERVSGTTGRYRLLETVRAFASQQARREGERDRFAAAHAEWVASLTAAHTTDLMAADAIACAVRLEREALNWRTAAGRAVDRGDRALARRLCGMATVHLIMGRPDLAPIAIGLRDLVTPDDPGWLTVVAARWAQAMAPTEGRSRTEAFFAVMDQAGPSDPTGVLRMLRSAHLIMQTDDVDGASAIRQSVIEDPEVGPRLRQQLVANKLYGLLMGPDTAPTEDLVTAVGWIADQTDDATTRLVSHLALAWACVKSGDHRAGNSHIAAAMAEDGPIPMAMRRIWRASVCRFLIHSDPRRSAALILSMLEEHMPDSWPADMTTLVTAAGVVASTGHPDADDIVATVAAVTSVPNLARTIPDIDDRIARGRTLAVKVFHQRLHRALASAALGESVPQG